MKTIKVARARKQYWLNYYFSDPFALAPLGLASLGKELTRI